MCIIHIWVCGKLPRSAYKDPHEGTILHTAMTMMMRLQGVTYVEFDKVAQPKNKNRLQTLTVPLQDECGFDVRAFFGAGKGLEGRQCAVYKIVGRYDWQGTYTSYIDLKDYREELEALRE